MSRVFPTKAATSITEPGLGVGDGRERLGVDHLDVVDPRPRGGESLEDPGPEDRGVALAARRRLPRRAQRPRQGEGADPLLRGEVRVA